MEPPSTRLGEVGRLKPGADQAVSPDDALLFAQEQVRKLVTTHPDQMPVYTENGRWQTEGDPWAPAWTGGFLAGMLWIFAARTGEPWWRERAEHYSRLLEPRKLDSGTHDLGFIFWPSWHRWLLGTRDAAASRVLVQAGRTMARRYQPNGRYLSTWVDPGSTFIDVMMNVNVVFHAAAAAADARLAEVAREHCLTTRRYLVRGDGSVAHEAWFDPQTGEHQRSSTHQGWRGDSTWARGQAWAIYGFGTAFSFTEDERFLDTARRCADYYIENTPPHGVPPNDWNDPAPTLPYESSAAAIAAAAFLRLSRLAPDAPCSARYREYGTAILRTLCSTAFLAMDTPGWEGVLKHATYHTANGLGVDQSVMWGDYYFTEGLDLLLEDPE